MNSCFKDASSLHSKGFLGFLINLQSYSEIFKLYVEEKKFLEYVLGHKLSQDHLEIMFGTIRSSLGLNNNPTVMQESFRNEEIKIHQTFGQYIQYIQKTILQ
jgi:hypothetical protein